MPVTEPTKAKSGGWAAFGKLFPGSNDQNVTLQVEFPISTTYTVQFSVSDPNTAVDRVQAEAEITWNVEGNFVRRLVNCANGVSVTGVAQGAKVVIRDASLVGALNTPVEYLVSVQIAPGPRSGQQNPLFAPIPNFVSIADASTEVFQIPAGAVAVYVAVVPNVPGAALPSNGVLVIQRTVAPISNTVFQWSPLVNTEWIPLVGGAAEILVANNVGGAAQISASVVFAIDG